MEQNDHPASARPKPRLTRAQYMRRKRLRLARNWAILLLVCAAVVALMTKGILWLLPKVNALLAGPQSFEAASYDGTAYAFDADDARLVLVNANLPYAEEPAPALAAVTDNSTIQLEAEAAEACRTMLEAAKADGIELVLNAGYLDVDGRSAVYETQKQAYLDAGKTEEQAASLAEDIQPRAECSEHGTGYAVDILSADYTTRDTGFAATRAIRAVPGLNALRLPVIAMTAHSDADEVSACLRAGTTVSRWVSEALAGETGSAPP